MFLEFNLFLIITALVTQYGNTGCGERFLPKNQHTQRKLLNFENWVNGEVSNIEHHFRKLSDFKMDVKVHLF